MNIFKAPQPRYRLYTNFKSYWSFLFDLVSGRLKKGNEVAELEKALTEKVGVANVVCISMARVGIYLTIKHLIKQGQEVIMSPYTIADVVNMVISAGGLPVFADIEQASCNLDPAKIEPLISGNTGAVLVTHLHGVSARIEEILAICQKHNLPLVEDAAQAFGTKVNGRWLGTFGTAGIYSFSMYKNVNGWYGGAVVSKNQELMEKIRAKLGQWPYQSPKFIAKRMLKGLVSDILTNPLIFKPLTYWIFRYGFLHDIHWINRWVEIELNLKRYDVFPQHYQARLTPWQARLILPQLARVEADSQNRLQKAELYHQGLKDIAGLVLAPMDFGSTCMYFPIQYADRQKLLKHLMRQGRDVAAQHLKNCADLPSFAAFHRDCPIAGKTANEVIILPTYPRYSITEVKKNIEAIQSFFGAGKSG